MVGAILAASDVRVDRRSSTSLWCSGLAYDLGRSEPHRQCVVVGRDRVQIRTQLG